MLISLEESDSDFSTSQKTQHYVSFEKMTAKEVNLELQSFVEMLEQKEAPEKKPIQF